MKKIIHLALVIPMVAQAATAPELLGKWVHVKYKSMRVEITDNGSSFVLSELIEERVKKYPAKLTDGILIANTGPCSLNVDIEKKTGHLLHGGQEYRRLNSGESFEYIKKGPPRF